METKKERWFFITFLTISATKTGRILPNFSEGISEDLVYYYVSRGYDVLFIDLKGETLDSKNYTKYPDDVSYANYSKCDKTFYSLNGTAKETCWYEWVAASKYAVSFLQKNNPKKPIFALGIKNGANVLWQLAGCDKRLSAAIFLFGAGWLSYKDIDKHDDYEIEMDFDRIRFLAGVDAQSYAKHVTCPVLYMGSSINKEFNAERAIDTLSYLENQKKVYFNINVSSGDVLDAKNLKTIDIFLDKYILKSKGKLPEYPLIDVDVKNDCLECNVKYSQGDQVKSICVYTSFDNVELCKRVWYKQYLTPNESGETNSTSEIITNFENLLSFVEVEYNNGLTLTSKFFYKNCSCNLVTNKPKILFNNEAYNVEFIVNNSSNDLLGGIFTKNQLHSVELGPNAIKGLTSSNTLSTYAIRNFVSDISDNSFIKFDVYAPSYLNLTLSIKCDENTYLYEIELSGGEVWQNVIVDFAEFKDENGFVIEDYSKITLLSFSSIGKYLLNNVMVLWLN